MSFDKKVRLYSAFDKTVKAAAQFLATPKTPTAAPAQTQIDFKLERTSFEESPSLQAGWVEIGDQILGFFDVNASQPIIDSSIDESVLNKIDRKNIKFFRAKSANSVDESMGVLAITPSQNIGSWKLFAKDGRPIGGHDQQLYVHKKP